MSILSDFLKEQGIKPEDLVARSKHIETQHIADRDLSAKRRMARANKKTYAELSLDKPKALGRPLTITALNKAMGGTPQPRLVRKKILRAVNSALVSKKAEAVDWRKLFADVPSRKGEKKKK
jgi:hypothetical protein